MTLADVCGAYNGSGADALYGQLKKLGPVGEIASAIFMAHKSSATAKVYRSQRRMAYRRKDWAMRDLTNALMAHAGDRFRWGWALDESQGYHCWLLYVDIPTGQISFHTARRGAGPDYPSSWDGSRREGAGRVCRWVHDLFQQHEQATERQMWEGVW